ncbi:MAG: AbrB/MazE/SpoVT family DNA-binding domain-containing protein [Candidatus Aenigmarchaeota archaeon]|nr:AbrB/MazE/SpoVT family DNA-binding domain-containing protein [Candidatus Aenigmarchaeota archaeon]
MDIGITKMSTKGQIVIPNDLRNEFPVGEKLVVIKMDCRLIIKKASELDKNLAEDLEFAKRTEDSLLRIEHGTGTKMEFDDFISEMKKW